MAKQFRDLVRYNTDVVPGTTTEGRLLGLASAAQIEVNVVRQPGDHDPIDNQLQRSLFKIESGDAAAPAAAAAVLDSPQQTIRDVWGQIVKQVAQSGGIIPKGRPELSPAPVMLSLSEISAFTSIFTHAWTVSFLGAAPATTVSFTSHAGDTFAGFQGTFGEMGHSHETNPATWSSYAQVGAPAGNVVFNITNNYTPSDLATDTGNVVVDLTGWTWTVAGASASPAAFVVGGSNATSFSTPWGSIESWYLTNTGEMYLGARSRGIYANPNPNVTYFPPISLAEAYTAAHGGGVTP